MPRPITKRSRGEVVEGAWSLVEEIKAHRGPINPKQLASLYGVSIPTIYEHIKRGDIPVIPGTKSADPKTLLYILHMKNPLLFEATGS